MVDGEAFTDTDTTDLAGDTVSGIYTVGNEEWTCIVTPDDGSASGVSGTQSVEIVPAIGRSADEAALSCSDLLDVWPSAPSGVYWINPVGTGAFEVLCDMETDGGGWTRVAVAPDSIGAPSGWPSPPDPQQP